MPDPLGIPGVIVNALVFDIVLCGVWQAVRDSCAFGKRNFECLAVLQTEIL